MCDERAAGICHTYLLNTVIFSSELIARYFMVTFSNLQNPSSSGLVLSSTSDTPSCLPSVSGIASGFVVDAWRSRAARLKKSVLNAANLHEQEVGKKSALIRSEQWRCLMLTLTYREDVEWEKSQITQLLKAIRQYLKRKAIVFRYVWVLENTKRGRPHYHILVWLPAGISLPKPDKRGWWVHGMSRVEWIRKNGAAYIAKYCVKNSHDSYAGGQGYFPKGARLHGCGGLSVDNRLIRTWWNFPKYVRQVFTTPHQDVKPAKGGGWFSRLTGEFLAAAYQIRSLSPLVIIPI